MGRRHRLLRCYLASLRACVVPNGCHDRQGDEWFARAAGASRIVSLSLSRVDACLQVVLTSHGRKSLQWQAELDELHKRSGGEERDNLVP